MAIKLTVLLDHVEEDWPSMELVGNQLVQNISKSFHDVIAVEPGRPAFRRRLGALPGKLPRNADRFLNRHVDFPRWLRRRAHDGFFHVSDHSYAHLANVVPATKTGVYLHDLDAFRCLLAPEAERRPWWFRQMTRRVLAGVQRASLVFYSTQATREAALSHGLVPEERLIYAPYGYTREFSPEGPTAVRGRPYLLHVGSCIPRKRVDLLLTVFAACHKRRPDLLLVKVGGKWSPEHLRLIEQHALSDVIRHEHDVKTEALAALYRGAGAVVLPSEAEGFGLPLLEALACGAPVVASDIAPFREVGGNACAYCPLFDVETWVTTLLGTLTRGAAGRQERVDRARMFSWARHAQVIGDAYLRLAGEAPRYNRHYHEPVSA